MVGEVRSVQETQNVWWRYGQRKARVPLGLRSSNDSELGPKKP